MHKWILLVNSITLSYILTQNWYLWLIIGLGYTVICITLYPKITNILINFIAILCSFAYITLLSHPHSNLETGEYQVSGIITQLQSQQTYFRRFTVLHDIQPWSLSWYGKGPPLQLGDCWVFKLKLKQQHRLQNPYQLFQNAMPIKPKYKASVIDARRCSRSGVIATLASWRGKIDHLIAASQLSIGAKRVVRSLGIGRQDQLQDSERYALQRTGTAHLFAISGLHLTTLALLIYSLATGLGWLYPNLYLSFPKPKFNLFIASFFAIIYSVLVGFSLPIQRALFMLLGFTIARIFDWRISAWKLLQLCIFIFLIFQPASVLLPSFWLSFVSVAILIYAFNNRVKLPRGIAQWWRAIWVAWLGTLGLNVLFFQQISVVAMLANAIAIPIVTLFIVPLILVGMCSIFVFPKIAMLCWWLANYMMQWLWFGLMKLADFPWSAVSISHYHTIIAIFIIAAALLYLLPRYLVYCVWGWGLLLMGLLNKPPEIPAGEFELHLLDVGQGLAALVKTQNHSLLYDTGPRYVNYDLGNAVVVPYLHWLNIRELDQIVVSHWDSDHSGGLKSILAAISTKQILSSDHGKQGVPVEYCLQGMQWQWDGVVFKFLYPDDQLLHLGNNSSCVLQVIAGNHSVLIPGDIEAFAEKVLLESPDQLKSQVLIAPHHGSKTSSTLKFIKAVSPSWVLFPVGWHNRFHLPKPQVLERYRMHGAKKMLRTDNDGAIRLRISGDAIRLVNIH